MARQEAQWVAPLLRREAYARLGGVDWIRRPGRAGQPLPWWLLAGPVLLAAGLVVLGFVARHSQQVTMPAQLTAVDPRCVPSVASCLWRLQFESTQRVRLKLGERITITSLELAPVTAAIEAIGEQHAIVVELDSPRLSQSPRHVAVQITISRSLAWWISSARGHVNGFTGDTQ